jgi:hypothetical protein
MNCLYELNHLAERRAALGSQVPEWLQALISFGCTAGAVRLADGRAVHVRNMDWPLQPIRTATRLFRFTDGDREFVTVGLPGLVGALSGMVPGAYSVTINYAPPTFLPGFAFGPLSSYEHCVLDMHARVQAACPVSALESHPGEGLLRQHNASLLAGAD